METDSTARDLQPAARAKPTPLSPKEEAALAVLALIACAEVPDNASLPYLDIIRSIPDPSSQNQASLNDDGKKLLPALKKIWDAGMGKTFYQNLHSSLPGSAVEGSLFAMNDALKNVAVTLNGGGDPWADDPPHPKSAALGSLSF